MIPFSRSQHICTCKYTCQRVLCLLTWRHRQRVPSHCFGKLWLWGGNFAECLLWLWGGNFADVVPGGPKRALPPPPYKILDPPMSIASMLNIIVEFTALSCHTYIIHLILEAYLVKISAGLIYLAIFCEVTTHQYCLPNIQKIIYACK